MGMIACSSSSCWGRWLRGGQAWTDHYGNIRFGIQDSPFRSNCFPCLIAIQWHLPSFALGDAASAVFVAFVVVLVAVLVAVG